jgi:hypothetical protein
LSSFQHDFSICRSFWQHCFCRAYSHGRVCLRSFQATSSQANFTLIIGRLKAHLFHSKSIKQHLEHNCPSFFGMDSTPPFC